MASARIGFKEYKTGVSVAREVAHIFREHGGIDGKAPDIISILKPTPNAFAKSPNKMYPTERRALQKKAQQYKSRAKKYRKKMQIAPCLQNKTKAKRLEQQAILNEAAEKHIRELLRATKVYGKNHIKFVELHLVITDTPPERDLCELLAKLVPNFIEEYWKNDVEIIAAAVHLDQASTHVHCVIKILSKPWSKICEERGGLEDAYYNASQAWFDFIQPYLKIQLNPLERFTAKKYVSLDQYKKLQKLEGALKKQKKELDESEKAIKMQETNLLEAKQLLNKFSSINDIILSLKGSILSLQDELEEIKEQQINLAIEKDEQLLVLSNSARVLTTPDQLDPDEDFSFMRKL